MEFKISFIFETILYQASESGNLDLVKYLVSLNEIDLNTRDDIFKNFYFLSSFYHINSWYFK